MFWFLIIFICLAVVVGAVLKSGQGDAGREASSTDDLSEEDIEYEYLQQEEREQEEEDEYWLEQRNK